MTAEDGGLGLTARNASVEDMIALLRGQQARKVDVVAPASAIRAESGLIVLDETVPVLSEDGVTASAGAYRPTEVCDAGIAEKLGIPAGYLRRMRGSRPRLYDHNVNGWLAGDDRSFFVRCLRGEDGRAGVARAWLSDSYKTIDHLDVLMAVFEGIRAAGQPVSIDSCDLTDKRMYVRVSCEAVRVLAPALLGDYRSPFTGARGADNPVMFAGFAITNSETGCGAATITPRLVRTSSATSSRAGTSPRAGSCTRSPPPPRCSPAATTPGTWRHPRRTRSPSPRPSDPLADGSRLTLPRGAGNRPSSLLEPP